MKVFILDTNIIFSAALKTESEIGKFILASNELEVEFYAPEYLNIEIERYVPKIVEFSGLEKAEIRKIINLLYTKITFISDSQIPFEYYTKALSFVRDIDMDDLVFVALTEYLDELLLTGDLKLYRGLIKKGYKKVVTFDYIKEHIL